MALWCFPIVSDLVRERYAAVIASLRVSVVGVAFSHTQLWHARILGDAAAVRKTREELGATLRELGLPSPLVEDIDEEILDELMDVVSQRFHRSPFMASTCGHILLHIAKNLAYTPEALTAA
jgi:hypothetical protein